MATWSISVSRAAHAPCRRNRVMRSSPTSARSSGSSMPEPLLGGQAEDADLALVEVAGGPGRRPRPPRSSGIDGRQRRQDLALADQPVGVPGLAVVGEVRALDGLELHPEVAVVVLDHVARGGGAGDDGAGPLAGEDRGAHGLAPGVLEDDVGVVAHQGPDVLAEPAPLRLVLGVLVLPEPVAGGPAVDDRLHPQVVQERRPSRPRRPPRPGCRRRSARTGRRSCRARRWPPTRAPGRPGSSAAPLCETSMR